MLTKQNGRKPYSINSARNYALGIRQLFRYYEMAVTLRNGSRVNKTVKRVRSSGLEDTKLFNGKGNRRAFQKF